MTIGCCGAAPEGNREVTDLRLLRNDRVPSPCNQNVRWQCCHFQALRAAAPNLSPPTAVHCNDAAQVSDPPVAVWLLSVFPPKTEFGPYYCRLFNLSCCKTPRTPFAWVMCQILKRCFVGAGPFCPTGQLSWPGAHHPCSSNANLVFPPIRGK